MMGMLPWLIGRRNHRVVYLPIEQARRGGKRLWRVVDRSGLVAGRRRAKTRRIQGADTTEIPTHSETLRRHGNACRTASHLAHEPFTGGARGQAPAETQSLLEHSRAMKMARAVRGGRSRSEAR